MVDAKKRKTEWEEKLKTFEVESLLITRDVLVATICLHKMEADDCTGNMEDTIKAVSYEGVTMCLIAWLTVYCCSPVHVCLTYEQRGGHNRNNVYKGHSSRSKMLIFHIVNAFLTSEEWTTSLQRTKWLAPT